MPSLAMLLGGLQTALLVLFLACTGTAMDDLLSNAEYVIFRDIMVMLLLGFGFLMTFLKYYGLSAIGFTMLLTVLAMQLNLLVEPLMLFFYEGSSAVSFPISIGITDLINAEFSAATLLISFGAVLGRASPVQLLVLALFQSVFYSINKVMVVVGSLGAEDVGGTITIHMFGAYFGITAARAFRSPKALTIENGTASSVSDLLSLLGTGLLWVYWPSFVGATETASPANETHCILHTVLALLGSTGATFLVSQHIVGKFDPVHIANATLAGGVAVGASGRLDMTPGGALLLGILAGAISVSGYVYISPTLESKLSIYDTCGVHNLHGLPSILGGLASAIFVTMDSNAEFLEHGRGQQAFRQLVAVAATLCLSVASGLLTGYAMVKLVPNTPQEYADDAWWEASYLDCAVYIDDDKSNRSRGSVRPVVDDEPQV